MTKGDIARLRFLKRPIKPVAFGLTFLMLCLTAFNLVNVDVFQGSLLGDAVAITAFLGAVILMTGWWFKKQHFAEAGLLIAGFVYLERTVFLVMTQWFQIGIFLGIGIAIIAFGSYFLESTDDRNDD